MSDLRSCPFCGGESELLQTGGIGCSKETFYIVECVLCWAKTSFCETEAEAIEAWNTRHERTCDGCDAYEHGLRDMQGMCEVCMRAYPDLYIQKGANDAD